MVKVINTACTTPAIVIGIFQLVMDMDIISTSICLATYMEWLVDITDKAFLGGSMKREKKKKKKKRHVFMLGMNILMMAIKVESRNKYRK